jgi:hypothetical protein
LLDWRVVAAIIKHPVIGRKVIYATLTSRRRFNAR